MVGIFFVTVVLLTGSSETVRARTLYCGRICRFGPAVQSPPMGSSPAWLRYLLLVCTWMFLLIRARSFYRHERQFHRFDPLPEAKQISRSWLRLFFSFFCKCFFHLYENSAGPIMVAVV